MNTLKGFIKPASKKASKAAKDGKKPNAPPMELDFTPPMSGVSTPMPSNLASPAASIFPQGDFRNAPATSVLDIKTDVMVNWLHHQQMEKMWSRGMPGEGVVLKKAR